MQYRRSNVAEDKRRRNASDWASIRQASSASWPLRSRNPFPLQGPCQPQRLALVCALAASVAILASACGGGARVQASVRPSPGPPASAWAIFGTSGILGTTDGAAHWTVLRKDGGRNASDLEGLSFVDASHGWAVGGHGPSDRYLILATTDGGLHWTEQLSRRAPRQGAGGLRGVCFVDRDHGWAVGNGAILATNNGGLNWIHQQAPSGVVFYSVSFADDLHGCAGGSGGAFVTNDGGAHWMPRATGLIGTSWYDVSCPDAQHYWATDGVLTTSSDGGTHWTAFSPFGGAVSFLAVCFPDRLHGWATGYVGWIAATSDGGLHWTRQRQTAPQTFLDVSFADDLHGWAVCGPGRHILATTDGGAHWVWQHAPTKEPITSVCSSP